MTTAYILITSEIEEIPKSFELECVTATHNLGLGLLLFGVLCRFVEQKTFEMVRTIISSQIDVFPKQSDPRVAPRLCAGRERDFFPRLFTY